MTAHEAETVEAVAEVHAKHERTATFLDRWVDILTSAFGRSTTAVGLVAVVCGWIAYNLVEQSAGLSFDPRPFPTLELAATLFALLLAVLILATQRRADRLAEQRAQLTLQAALLNDRKLAKIVSLLEELRHDMPTVRDRDDKESAAMAEATDPSAVLEKLESRK